MCLGHRSQVAILCIPLWLAVLIAGCDDATDDYLEKKIIAGGTVVPDSDGLLKVITTTAMVDDMVSALMGDDAHVNTIFGPATDPHQFEPNRGDAIRILNADIVIYNGLNLESHLDELFQRRRNAGEPTIAVAELLPPINRLETDTGVVDPHVWMDVNRWNDATDRLARRLDPLVTFRKDRLYRRSKEYRKQLMVLDRWGEAAIETIPESQRLFFASHDAFRYFEDRYGVKVRVFQDDVVSDFSASPSADLTISMTGTRPHTAFFIKQTGSGEPIESLLPRANSNSAKDANKWVVFTDFPGDADSEQNSYLGMMKHNFKMVCSRLGGNPDSVDWQAIVDEVDLEMAEDTPEEKDEDAKEELRIGV